MTAQFIRDSYTKHLIARTAATKEQFASQCPERRGGERPATLSVARQPATTSVAHQPAATGTTRQQLVRKLETSASSKLGSPKATRPRILAELQRRARQGQQKSRSGLSLGDQEDDTPTTHGSHWDVFAFTTKGAAIREESIPFQSRWFMFLLDDMETVLAQQKYDFDLSGDFFTQAERNEFDDLLLRFGAGPTLGNRSITRIAIMDRKDWQVKKDQYGKETLATDDGMFGYARSSRGVRPYLRQNPKWRGRLFTRTGCALKDGECHCNMLSQCMVTTFTSVTRAVL